MSARRADTMNSRGYYLGGDDSRGSVQQPEQLSSSTRGATGRTDVGGVRIPTTARSTSCPMRTRRQEPLLANVSRFTAGLRRCAARARELQKRRGCDVPRHASTTHAHNNGCALAATAHHERHLIVHCFHVEAADFSGYVPISRDHHGIPTGISGSAIGWLGPSIARCRVNTTGPSRDVVSIQGRPTAVSSSAITRHVQGVHSPNGRAKKHFGEMGMDIKLSVCGHKAKGVQSDRAKLAERGHLHQPAEGCLDASGRLARHHTRVSYARSIFSCTTDPGSASLCKFKTMAEQGFTPTLLERDVNSRISGWLAASQDTHMGSCIFPTSMPLVNNASAAAREASDRSLCSWQGGRTAQLSFSTCACNRSFDNYMCCTVSGSTGTTSIGWPLRGAVSTTRGRANGRSAMQRYQPCGITRGI